MGDTTLKLCVDSNEASSRKDIINYLRLAGVQISIQKLPVCDYVVSDRCGVERKDVSDFLGSIKDGRLFTQAKDMAENYEKPILILEGQMNHALRRSKMKPVSIYGALSSITLGQAAQHDGFIAMIGRIGGCCLRCELLSSRNPLPPGSASEWKPGGLPLGRGAKTGVAGTGGCAELAPGEREPQAFRASLIR